MYEKIIFAFHSLFPFTLPVLFLPFSLPNGMQSVSPLSLSHLFHICFFTFVVVILLISFSLLRPTPSSLAGGQLFQLFCVASLVKA